MGIFELFVLAVGLSMDAFAVSVCKGLSLGKINIKHMVIAGAWFGSFQALMPLIGYFLGTRFAYFVNMYDHWIAFGLLLKSMEKRKTQNRILPHKLILRGSTEA